MTRFIATLFVASLALTLSPSPAALGQAKVALVDLGKIIQNSRQYQLDVETAAAKVGNFEEKITRAQKEIQDVVALLEKAPEGSDEAQQLQELIRTIQTDTQRELQGMQQKMQQAEMETILNTYKKIQAVLDDYCTKNDIDVVVRYDSEPLDPTADPQTLSAQLNNRIMWHKDGMDITDKVLAILDKDVPAEEPADEPADKEEEKKETE